MRGVALACCLTLAMPLPAAAQDFCDMLEEMIAGRAVASTDAMLCSSSKGQSGATAQHCRWPFSFRAADAHAAFEAVSADVAACLNAPAKTEEGEVNHPDTYDQRLFETQSGMISVALKDKGALQQTFVFLRVERNAP